MFVKEKNGSNKHTNTPDKRSKFDDEEEDKIPILSAFANEKKASNDAKEKDALASHRSLCLKRKR